MWLYIAPHVLDHLPVSHSYMSAGAIPHLDIVGDDQQRNALGVQRLDGSKDLGARGVVQVARRLIRKQYRRLHHHRASDRDTLALAARQLVRSMTRTALEAQALEQLLHTGAPYLRRDSRQNQGQLDILERGQPWNQVERLEDEADLARPRPCQLVVVQRSG